MSLNKHHDVGCREVQRVGPRDDPYGNRFNECRQCGRFSPTAVATVEGFVDAAVVG